MSKKMLLITLGILVVITGGGTYLLLSDSGKQAKKEMAEKNSANQSAASSLEENKVINEPSGIPGNYVDYKEGIIAETPGTKLLFFHAPWCPQCRALEADIRKDGVPEGVTIIKIDYDSNQSLRQKYGVTIQTTVVRIDDSGKEIEKYVAYDEPTLDSVIKNLL